MLLGTDIGPALVAITPPSDIVLDVARAADPEKYRAAVERLARLRGAAPAPEAFSQSVASRAPAAPAREPGILGPRTTVTRAIDDRGGTAASADRRLDAYGQFEAFVLQTFVQSMLPKNATSVFGSGTAGEVWRSMLAEKMGNEVARSGQVGIARKLAAGTGHEVRLGSAQAAVPASPPPPDSALMRAPQPEIMDAPSAEPIVDLSTVTVERS